MELSRRPPFRLLRLPGAVRFSPIAWRPEAPGPVELLDEEVLTPGEVTVCCTTDQDIHKVSAATDEPCIGIHIYGGNIGKIRREKCAPDTGEVGYFTSFWSEPVDA